MEILPARFVTSRPRSCPTVLLNTLWLPRRSRYLMLRPPMFLPVVWPGPLRIRPLDSAGTARRVNRPRAADSFCRDLPSLSVRFSGRPRRLTARRRHFYIKLTEVIQNCFGLKYCGCLPLIGLKAVYCLAQYPYNVTFPTSLVTQSQMLGCFRITNLEVLGNGLYWYSPAKPK
jgi:hypothetical protein